MATVDRTRAAALDAAFDTLLAGIDHPVDHQAAAVPEEDLAMLRHLHDGWLHSSPDPAFVRRLGANLASLHRPPATTTGADAVRFTGGPAQALPVPGGRWGESWAPARRDRRPWIAAATVALCAVLVATVLLGRGDERRETIPAGAVASPPAASRAVVLMIDVSGSMSYDPLGGTAKIDEVKAATNAVLMDLAPGDWFGVLAFNDQHAWVVPLAPLAGVDEREGAQAAIGDIRAEGGTEPYPALLVAIEALSTATPADKHLVILSDGRGRTGTPEQYRAAAETATAGGITISTVALGADAATDILQLLAELGGGRYHLAPRTEEIPLAVDLILGFVVPSDLGRIDTAPGASPEPGGVRSDPIAVQIAVDTEGLLGGDSVAEAEAVEQLRTAAAPLLAAGCRVGFVIAKGTAPDIATGNQIADAVNALLRDGFPDLVNPETTGFYSVAHVGETAGTVDLLLFPNTGCNVT